MVEGKGPNGRDTLTREGTLIQDILRLIEAYQFEGMGGGGEEEFGAPRLCSECGAWSQSYARSGDITTCSACLLPSKG